MNLGEPVATTWGFIEPGALVADAEGKPWRVTDRRINLPVIAFAIWDGAQRALWVTKLYEDEVMLFDEQMGRAVALMQNELGATLMLDPLPHGPDSKFLRSKYISHLNHHHGVGLPGSPDSPTNKLEDLIQLHAIQHAGDMSRAIPHTHRRS